MVSYLLLDAAPAGGGGMGNFGMLIFFGLFFLVFWFFIMRPQSKKAKEQKKFIANLEKGAKVVTIGGLHGIISKVNEDSTTLMLDLGAGMPVKIERSAISMEATIAIQKAEGNDIAKK